MNLIKPFINSISETEINKKRITSKRQALIKLIEKKDKDKHFIKNCRPISLLIMVLMITPNPNPNPNWGGGGNFSRGQLCGHH